MFLLWNSSYTTKLWHNDDLYKVRIDVEDGSVDITSSLSSKLPWSSRTITLLSMSWLWMSAYLGEFYRLSLLEKIPMLPFVVVGGGCNAKVKCGPLVYEWFGRGASAWSMADWPINSSTGHVTFFNELHLGNCLLFSLFFDLLTMAIALAFCWLDFS